MITLFTFNIIRVLVLAAFSAIVAFFWVWILIKLLNKFQFWKKSARKKTISGEDAKVFYELHKKREVTVPRGGGLLIWFTTLFVVFFFFILAQIFSDIWWLRELNFLSRGETWLPLFTLITASIVGFFDDILEVFSKGKYIGGGMSFLRRLLIVILIGAIGGWWFYVRLGWETIHLPLIGEVYLGILYVFLFILVTLACWAGGIVDGLDGLAGGTFLSIFGAFVVIAFSQGKFDLAAFSAP